METTREEEKELLSAFSSLFNDIVTIAKYRTMGNHNEDALKKKGSYSFIPFSSIRAYLMFYHLKKWVGDRRAKFLDAGCGIGNILMIAKKAKLANEYHGLEYFDNVKNEAEHFLGLDIKDPLARYLSPNISVKKADIATYKHYGEYDFIYYYCPFCNIKKEKDFELRIEDQMKVGAILIPMMKNSYLITKDKRFKEILPKQPNWLNNIWVKIKK